MQQSMTLAPPDGLVGATPVVVSPAKTVTILLPGSTRPQVARLMRPVERTTDPLSIPLLIGGACLFAVYILLAIVVFLVAIVLRDIVHGAIYCVRAPFEAR